MPDLSAKGITSMGVTINDPQLLMSGRFQTPITNLAIFHQSTLNFTKTFSATIGVRLDHEHNSITYNSTGAINYDFNALLAAHHHRRNFTPCEGLCLRPL